MLELPKLPKLGLASAERQAKLERWARFLRARTSEELEQLAQEDEIMVTAKQALEELSSDKEAQRLARERETAVLVHRHLLGSSFDAGKVEGLVRAVRSACGFLGIELDAARTEQLEQLDVHELEQLLKGLETERRWPEGF